MPISYDVLLAQMLLCIIYGQDVNESIFNYLFFVEHYFIFRSGILNNILSQMCGRWYFPIFLLSVGLFTLIYIDSMIVLAKLLSSLPIILKFSIDVSWPLMFWCWNIWWWGLQVFLVSFLKCSPWVTNVLFSTVNAPTCVAIYYTVLAGNTIFVFGWH